MSSVTAAELWKRLPLSLHALIEAITTSIPDRFQGHIALTDGLAPDLTA
jgi:hypothetical protein